jgi:hypothetical protein
MPPATLFAYMWVFAVLPALTSAIVVVKYFLELHEELLCGAPLTGKGNDFNFLLRLSNLIFRPKEW